MNDPHTPLHPTAEKRHGAFGIVLGVQLSLFTGVLYAAALWQMSALQLNLNSTALTGFGGWRVFFNALFAQSELHQNYTYTRLETDGSGALLFLLLVTAAAAALLLLAQAKRLTLLPVALMLTLAGTEVYFGIAPGMLLNVAVFFALLAFALLTCGKRLSRASLLRSAAVLCVAVLIGGIAFAAFPKEYRDGIPAVQAVNERVRDSLDDGEKRVASRLGLEVPVNTVYQDSKPQEAAQDDTPQETDNGFGGEDRAGTHTTRITLTVMNVVLLCILAVLLLAYLLLFLIKTAQRAHALHQSDPAAVLDSAFRYAVLYLAAGGVTVQQRHYLDLIPEIETAYSNTVSRAYAQLLTQWQGMTYGGKPVSGEAAQTALDFYRSVKKATRKKLSPPAYLKLKFIKFL